MVTIKHKGNFNKLTKYFKKSVKITNQEKINLIADDCLKKLKDATPVDSGITADSWYYEITEKKGFKRITFYNTNIQNGTKIVLLLEYGHLTNNGTWVQGRKFMTPIIEKTYKTIVDKTWKELTNL